MKKRWVWKCRERRLIMKDLIYICSPLRGNANLIQKIKKKKLGVSSKIDSSRLFLEEGVMRSE